MNSIMNQRVKHISEEIRRLTPGEQAELLAEISDVVAPAEQAAIDQAWIEEADRRLGEIDRGEVETIPAQAALAQLRGRFSRQP